MLSSQVSSAPCQNPAEWSRAKSNPAHLTSTHGSYSACLTVHKTFPPRASGGQKDLILLATTAHYFICLHQTFLPSTVVASSLRFLQCFCVPFFFARKITERLWELVVGHLPCFRNCDPSTDSRLETSSLKKILTVLEIPPHAQGFANLHLLLASVSRLYHSPA